MHCNYKRYDDGTAYPIATEYDNNYKTTGSVDVGSMQMSFYWNWDASNPEYDLITISDTPNYKYKLKPWTECKRADGSVVPYCIGSSYISGIASDDLYRSQPNLCPARNQSYNNIYSNYHKKGKGYKGAGAERNTFAILFTIIKGATKNSQSIFAGCTSYNFQYSASIQSEESHEYFPVTNAQAANIVVGSTVSVGYGSANGSVVNNDRGISTIHKYVDCKRVSKIEKLDENNMAVYFEGNITPFTTTSVTLNDTLNAQIMLSSMHWYSGSTDCVIGRHDGSRVSNINGKYPCRIQGREYFVGGYIVASDTVMDFQSDYSKNVYVCPKGVARSTSDTTIRNTYTLIGNIPANSDSKGSDLWVGDISVDTETGCWYPSVQGSGNSQGFADIVYAGGISTSGTREYLMSGSLGAGSGSGLVFLDCGSGLGWGHWLYLAAD